MPIFEYQGRYADGRLTNGRRMAQSAESLNTQLQKDGLTPIHIVPVSESKNYFKKMIAALQNRPVTVDELSIFARQMHILLKTGVTVTHALKQLAENSRSKQLSHALYSIIESLESGQDLAQTMQGYPEIFTPVMISMVRVGQSTGHLDEAFLRLNQYLELEANTLKRVKTVLRYPAIVLSAIVFAIIMINVFVVPTFATVFSQAHVELPAMTRVLIATSNFMREYWLLLFILLCLGAVWIIYYLKSTQGRLAWDRFQLRIPVIGNILKRIILLRFAQSFAVTVNSGISVLEGIKLVAEDTQNQFAKQEIYSLSESIQRGKNLTQAALDTTLFTSLELQMLSVSEETGELGAMMEQIAAFYRREVDYDLKRLNDLIEPALIVILSLLILMLAFAVYLPIWDMVKLVHY